MGEKKPEIFIISKDKVNIHVGLNDTSKYDDDKAEDEADFETAIKAAGLGKFNVMLFFVAFPACFAAIIDPTTMSYIIPVAQCDLNLTLANMGMLNAVTYIGMISSGFIWGYLADTIGRKRLLIIGFLLDAIFVVVCGLSQQYLMLIIAKFMTGLMINGPFAVLMSYMNEFNCAKNRTIIPSIHGFINSLALICLPLLAWLIFSDSINVILIDNQLVLRSWNIFLLICSLPSLFSAVIFTLLPETPKFLMAEGRNNEAMKVFQTIYAWNSGKTPEEYPIKKLVDERKLHEKKEHLHGGHVTANRTKVQALKEGWQQIQPLFYPPYLSKLLLVFTIQFGIMWCANTLRLWFPQMFTAINDYQKFNPDDQDADLCKMIELINPNKTLNKEECVVNYDNSSVYVNNITVWVVYITMCVIFAGVVRLIGKRMVLILAGISAGSLGSCLYFAKTEAAAVALSSLFNGFSTIFSTFMVSIVVDIFPTHFRTMSLAMMMVFGRTGAMVGNLTFPLLLSAGCLPPFLTIGCIAICCSLFAMLLPKTDMKPLE